MKRPLRLELIDRRHFGLSSAMKVQPVNHRGPITINRSRAFTDYDRSRAAVVNFNAALDAVVKLRDVLREQGILRLRSGEANGAGDAKMTAEEWERFMRQQQNEQAAQAHADREGIAQDIGRISAGYDQVQQADHSDAAAPQRPLS